MDICDDFLTSLPIEPGMLMSGDRMDFAMDDVASTCSSELLDDGYMSPQSYQHSDTYGRSIKTEPTFSCSSDESVDLNAFSDDFKTINPDDFLTDFFKREVKSEANSFSPNRETPSPSASSSDSTGSDMADSDFRIDMSNTNDHKPAKVFHFDTPPISPPSPDGSTSSSNSSSSASLNHQTISTNMNAIQGRPMNIIQGTLIPISTVPINMTTVSSIATTPISNTNTNLPPNFKKIKIQPKTPQSNASNPIKKSGQAKTIILSAQDYSALVQKCKSQQSTPGAKPITIKAANIKSAPAVANPYTPAPVVPNVITPNIITPNVITPNVIAQNLITPNVITSNVLPPTIQPIQIQRPTVVQAQPLLMSGMMAKTTPIIATSVPINKIHIPVTATNVITPVVLQSRSMPATTCVTTVRTVTTTPASHPPPLRVAPKPAGTAPVVEDKFAKKQQRMIKNRESACLSRKKKKDYMTSLETQISQLTESNQKLKSQNTFLRDRISQMEKAVCQCGKAFDRQISSLLQPSSAKKKNAMFLLAMVFMVSLNFGPFGNLLSAQTGSELQNEDSSVYHSRNLLWVDEDANGNSLNSTEKSRVSNPLIYRGVNLTTPVNNNHSNSSLYPTCPLHVNQSESVRLASELRRWIGDLPHYLNLSATQAESKSNHFDLNTISDYLLKDDTIKSLFKHLKNIKSTETPTKNDLSQTRKASDRNQSLASANNSSNRLQLYDPIHRDALKYAELFEELRRQDDTFYVVSFSGDHLLLPALAHNKTFRPKMSLMLPSVGINMTYGPSQYVTLMQIDCEVINTSLIQIQSRLIPPHLRSKTNRESSSGRAKASTAHNIKSANRTATNEYAKRSRTANVRTKPLQLHSTAPEHKLNVTHTDYDYEGTFNETAHQLLFNATRESEFDYKAAPPQQQFKPYFMDEPREKKRTIRADGA